jgi:deoxyribodipyrimidine photo-lyase
LYIFNSTANSINKWGFKRQGGFRNKFIVECLEDLHSQLKKYDTGLRVEIGNPIEILKDYIEEYSVSTIYIDKEDTYEELLIEDFLYAQKNLETITEYTKTLIHPNNLPFPEFKLPNSFTPFRKQIEDRFKIIESLGLVNMLPSIPGNFVKELGITTEFLENLEISEPDIRTAHNLLGGETEALKRLEFYTFETQALSEYKETRNGLIGERYSSKLSSYLALGCITPTQVYEKVKQYENEFGANESTYWLVFELLWRDYFRYVARKWGNKIFQSTGIQNGKTYPTKFDKKIFKKWINGETGDDFVDAAMIELSLTGYLSNRMRQNVASYFAKTLQLDWRAGAAWFENRLIDYDVCSNYGNWLYLAGVGNDPRDRTFNSNRQAEMYDPDGEYRAYWLG